MVFDKTHGVDEIDPRITRIDTDMNGCLIEDT